MAYQCELVEQQARPTLAVRTRSAVERLPQVLGPAWGQVMACAGKAGATPSDAPYVAYHNMDMQDLDLEVGCTFAQPQAGEGIRALPKPEANAWRTRAKRAHPRRACPRRACGRMRSGSWSGSAGSWWRCGWRPGRGS